MSKWIRKGDKVLVIAGNDKGQVGTVLSKSKDKVVVEGINKRKKHMKPREQNKHGEIVEMEMPINISNISICSDDNKPIKLKVRVNDKAEKQLIYKVDGKEKVYRSTKKPAKAKK